MVHELKFKAGKSFKAQKFVDRTHSMAAAVESGPSPRSENGTLTGCRLCALPWWQKKPVEGRQDVSENHSTRRPPVQNGQSLLASAKASLLTRCRLRLDPEKKLFFMYEPGKQVSSIVKIRNASRSSVAFKFQTNAPKSCFMRPPNGILGPKESITTTVVKFVEQPENTQERKKTKDKFKIVSLKVREGVEFTPELFDENKESLTVEKVLRVVFLDPLRPSKELEKLKKRIAEAEADNEARKKPVDDKAAKPPGPTESVLGQWKVERQKYLARRAAEGADSV